MYWLVVIAVVASAIGIYYYLRVMVFMYMQEAVDDIADIQLPLVTRFVIVVMIIGTIYMGVLPGSLLELASEAVNF